jgi:hypothetical protein
VGTLDQPTGSNVSRKIKFVDVTGYTPAQIETAYNNNYGTKGWHIIQALEIGSNRYIIAEKEE